MKRWVEVINLRDKLRFWIVEAQQTSLLWYHPSHWPLTLQFKAQSPPASVKLPMHHIAQTQEKKSEKTSHNCALSRSGVLGHVSSFFVALLRKPPIENHHGEHPSGFSPNLIVTVKSSYLLCSWSSDRFYWTRLSTHVVHHSAFSDSHAIWCGDTNRITKTSLDLRIHFSIFRPSSRWQLVLRLSLFSFASEGWQSLRISLWRFKLTANLFTNTMMKRRGIRAPVKSLSILKPFLKPDSRSRSTCLAQWYSPRMDSYLSLCSMVETWQALTIAKQNMFTAQLL